MKKNTLSPDLDLLCKALCGNVLGDNNYHTLSNNDLNKISAFLILFNPEFSSSRESLNKSLQNWFLGKNTPSPAKLEEISKSLGFSGHSDFVFQNKRKIRVISWQQSSFQNPFQRTLLLCGFFLLLALFFPLLTGLPIGKTADAPIEVANYWHPLSRRWWLFYFILLPVLPISAEETKLGDSPRTVLMKLHVLLTNFSKVGNTFG